MVDISKESLVPISQYDFERAHCDKYDYIISASCGVMAGFVDMFFVGAPGTSILQGTVDKSADELVKKSAELFYKFDKRTTGKPRACPDTLDKAISYLEQAFPVVYDARYAKDLKVAEGVLSHMSSSNHHLLSICHAPDIFGLIFSIIAQFTDAGAYIDKGTLIMVKPNKKSGAIPYLQGTNVVSKIFCGFVNWIGHMLSDLVGSSSTREPGKKGRGMGLPMPFYELFLLFDNKDMDGNSIASIATKAFEEGYDVRFGATMAIPVVLNDLFIRFIWSMKKHFYAKQEWMNCIPTNKNDDLRVMIILGTGSMCAIDGLDAVIRGGAEGFGTPAALVTIMLHMNLVAWAKLATMGFKEVIIRFNYTLEDMLKPFEDAQKVLLAYLTELEKIDFEEYAKAVDAYNVFIKKLDGIDNEKELNTILIGTFKEMNLPIPWQGDFDEFMSDRNNQLVFE